MIFILLIFSLIVNVILVYTHKNWEYRFSQQLLEDTRFEDSDGNPFYLKKGDEVIVHLIRHNDKIHVTVGTETIHFTVNHSFKKTESDNKIEGIGE